MRSASRGKPGSRFLSAAGASGDGNSVFILRNPVWRLEQMRRQGISEAEILRSDPSLRAEDLVNAWRYVDAHRPEIESQIRDNEEA